jgi:hypothetical protein
MRVEYSDLSKKDFKELQNYLFDHFKILVFRKILDKYEKAINFANSTHSIFQKRFP